LGNSKLMSAIVFLLFLLCGISLPSLSGLLIFPFSMVPESHDLTYRISISIIFLVSAVGTRRITKYRKYSNILFAFFIASIAINMQVISSLPSLEMAPIYVLVLRMLLSTVLVVAPILALSLVSGDRIQNIFLSRGNVKLGLLLGLGGFLAFALLSIPTATFLFQGRDLSLSRVFPWLPFILVIVLANGAREELLYRGIFLGKLGPMFGAVGSNFLQAIFFSLSHTVAGRGSITYTPFTAAFVLFTFLLGLLWGYIMQRTGSALGPILFHAGSDIPVFLGIISNL
jgi:membrane protease YdiL (CAAX protease family)